MWKLDTTTHEWASFRGAHAPTGMVPPPSSKHVMSVQGTKLGSKLMAAVAAMADADGLPCYTEVSGSTRDVYAHLGYEEQAVYTVSIAGDEAEHAPFGELYAMVRPPKGAK